MNSGGIAPSAEKVVGKYRLLSKLGEGGMGAVYSAEHVVIGGRFAVKILLRELALNPEVAARFQNEARATAAIGHEGIVKIFDFGETDDRSFYIVMELLEGHSMARRLREGGPMQLDLLVDLVRQIAAAVGAAHAIGIVHRDLKPDNIFLVPDGAVASGVRAKVLDFGIAKLREQETSMKTQAGLIIGSPACMSPEQCRGSADIDLRSDIYSLGCVMYEMACGRPPFVRASVGELLVAHLRDPMPPLRSVLPTLPAALEAVVARATEKDPADRYQSLQELAAALDQILPPRALSTSSTIVGAEPVGALPPPSMPNVTMALADSPDVVSSVQWFGTPSYVAPALSTRGDVPRAPAIIVLQSFVGEADASSIATLLERLFGRVDAVAGSLLSMAEPHFPARPGLQFFCLAIPGPFEAYAGQNEVGVRTMARYSAPLEEQLAAMDELEKVVLVVTGSAALSPGVRRKILEYRRRFRAFVLPLCLAEVRAAIKKERVRELFLSRLNDLHTPVDPYGHAGPMQDALQFFGMRSELNELLVSLEKPGAAVAVFGRPGIGKSSLLNIAEYSYPGRFVRLACASISPPTVDGVVAEVSRALRTHFGAGNTLFDPAQANQPNIRNTLYMAVPKNRPEHGETVLILDDADLLLDCLDGPGGAMRDGAAQFWSTVAEWCDQRRMRAVVTGVRAFLLKDKRLPAWQDRHNPLATHIKLIGLGPFSPALCRQYIVDTGLQAGLEFEARALDVLCRLSAGYVDVARALCSRAFQYRERTDSELSAMRIREEHVRRGAEELMASGDVFRDTLSCLRDEERRVLEAVACRRPRSLAALKRSLGGALAPDAVADALGRLHKLGLVTRARGREVVHFPLLEEGLVQGVHPVLDEEGGGRRRLLAFGLGLTLVFFSLWLMLVLEPKRGEVKGRHEGCELLAVYDKYGISGEDTNIDIQCACKSVERSFRLEMKDNIAPGDLTVPCRYAPAQSQLKLKLPAAVEGEQNFRFALVSEEAELLKFEIKNDWRRFALHKAELAGGIMTTIPGTVAAIITYSEELQRALARLGETFGVIRRQRRRDGEPPPPEDEAPKQ
jgi:serine/threonine protein kinase